MDLVGVDVPVLEDVAAESLQLPDVTVQGLPAHFLQLLQHFSLHVARHLKSNS